MKPILLTILTLIMMTGCATNKHLYTSDGKCITCWNNPITGKPVNHNGEVKATTISSGIRLEDLQLDEGRVTFDTSVETAWMLVMIKKELSFYTKEEIDELNRNTLNKKTYKPFEHITDGEGNHRFLGEREHKGHVLKFDVLLERHEEFSKKMSGDYSIVTITYSPNSIPKYDESRLNRSIKSRFISVVLSTPPKGWREERNQ